MTNHSRLLHRLALLTTILAGLLWIVLAPGVSLAAPSGKGKPPAPSGPRTIVFSGEEWTVKDSGNSRWGPGPNFFSPSTSNVWVDSQGRLHLKISSSKASDPTNAQYVVQPYDDPGNLVRFTQPQLLAQSTHLFDWRPDRVDFKSLYGHQTSPAIPGDLIAEWSFADAGQVPPAGGEQARINLWLFRGGAPSDGKPVEVVVSRFEFVPATP